MSYEEVIRRFNDGWYAAEKALNHCKTRLKMTDIMLDLETLGTRPGSAIVAIGAVVMDFTTMTLTREFYSTISVSSALKAGLTVDGDTLEWWMRQDAEARTAFSEGEHLAQVLRDFAMGLPPDARVWGNGADFDNVLLAAAYRSIHLPCPWKFYNNRCYRTLKNMIPHIKLKRIGTHHNALDDARSQALHMFELLKGPGWGWAGVLDAVKT